MHMWESKHAYKKWPERVWMHTWAVIHKALSRSEVSTQLRNNFEHVIEQNKIDHVWQLNQTNNQSIIRKSHMLGPPKPDWSCMNWSHKFHYFGIMKIHYSCLCKTKRSRRSFENQSGIKAIWEKIRFLKFNWKLESRKSLENWSFKVYLKIGILKLNTRMRILEIKFEKNWNFG